MLQGLAGMISRFYHAISLAASTPAIFTFHFHPLHPVRIPAALRRPTPFARKLMVPRKRENHLYPMTHLSS